MANPVQGSKEHPVRLDPWQKIVKVQWPAPYALIEFTQPDDAQIDLLVGGKYTPIGQVVRSDIDGYAVGDTISAPADIISFVDGTFLFEILFLEDNPITGAEGGFWAPNLTLQNPYNFTADAPTFVVEDMITPNPYHALDQATADAWTEKGKADATTLYNNGLSDNAKFLSDWEELNSDQTIRFRTISSLAEYDPYGEDSGSFGDRIRTVNIPPYILHSGLNSYVEMGSEAIHLDPQLFYEDVELFLESGLSGTLRWYSTHSITQTIGDIWHTIALNRKTYLIDTTKMGDAKVDVVLITPTKDRTGTVTTESVVYKPKPGSNFVVQANRKVQSAVSDTDALVETLDCLSPAPNTILTSFDKNGFV